MKPRHACRATQDGQVMVERSDRMWSTGEGNGKPLHYSCLENPMNSIKRQNDRILKEELPRSVGPQYATGDQWRNNSRKNEGMKPKQKQWVTGDRSKVRCCKEQYCIGTWNVRSMNQGKLVQFNSVQFSHSVMFDSLKPHGLQHTRLFSPSSTQGGCSNSCPTTQWCHPTISSSAYNLSQHQGLFQWVSSLHQVAKVLEFQL